MQISKEDIRAEILRQAAGIFGSRGFARSSMRDIAEAARVCPSNIYNYFPGKDALFREVVRPAVRSFDRMLEEHHGRQGADIMEMLSESYFRQVVEEYVLLLREYRTELQLLFFRAQGSSLEHYREEFTDRSTMLVREYFREMKRRHPQIDVDVSDFFIHLHTAWMFTLFEELLMHRTGPDETERIVTEYITFEITGWRELIKI